MAVSEDKNSCSVKEAQIPVMKIPKITRAAHQKNTTGKRQPAKTVQSSNYTQPEPMSRENLRKTRLLDIEKIETDKTKVLKAGMAEP